MTFAEESCFEVWGLGSGVWQNGGSFVGCLREIWKKGDQTVDSGWRDGRLLDCPSLAFNYKHINSHFHLTHDIP